MFFMPWPWGLRMILVVCGFWGFVLFWFAWLSVVGLGWAWSGFLDCCTDFGFWLAACLWLVGACFCWFCLESLILAQDERWRRA